MGTAAASQIQVLTDARELEASGCLSAGFTSKLTQAYRDSVRPQGAPLGRYLTGGHPVNRQPTDGYGDDQP